MVFLVLAVLVTLTAAATVWLAGSRTHRENDPDSTFWYTFTGLCILAPMILIPAMTSNLVSCVLFLLAAATAIATHLFCRRQAELAAASGHRSELAAAVAGISERHRALIAQWSRYELDPGAAIDFPSMSDVSVPETSALIRAVTAANRLLPTGMNHFTGDGASPGPSLSLGSVLSSGSGMSTMTDDGVAAYQRAVTELAAALETAEEAARRCQRG